jgi:hypothetical protein
MKSKWMSFLAIVARLSTYVEPATVMLPEINLNLFNTMFLPSSSHRPRHPKFNQVIHVAQNSLSWPMFSHVAQKMLSTKISRPPSPPRRKKTCSPSSLSVSPEAARGGSTAPPWPAQHRPPPPPFPALVSLGSLFSFPSSLFPSLPTRVGRWGERTFAVADRPPPPPPSIWVSPGSLFSSPSSLSPSLLTR